MPPVVVSIKLLLARLSWCGAGRCVCVCVPSWWLASVMCVLDLVVHTVIHAACLRQQCLGGAMLVPPVRGGVCSVATRRTVVDIIDTHWLLTISFVACLLALTTTNIIIIIIIINDSCDIGFYCFFCCCDRCCDFYHFGYGCYFPDCL